jgi:hypothetical protein
VVSAIGALIGASLPAIGADIGIPIKVYMNKPGRLTKFIAKGSFALPTEDPRNVGGFVSFSDGTSPMGAFVADPETWKGLADGANGYRSKNGGCKTIIIKPNLIKGICPPTSPGEPPWDNAPVSIVVEVGEGTTRYYGECPNGGTQTGNPATKTKFKDCGVPAMAPNANYWMETSDGGIDAPNPGCHRQYADEDLCSEPTGLVSGDGCIDGVRLWEWQKLPNICHPSQLDREVINCSTYCTNGTCVKDVGFCGNDSNGMAINSAHCLCP